MFMLKDIYPNYNTILLKIDRTNHKISRKYHILQGVYYKGVGRSANRPIFVSFTVNRPCFLRENRNRHFSCTVKDYRPGTSQRSTRGQRWQIFVEKHL
jgi:hypothetical protein